MKNIKLLFNSYWWNRQWYDIVVTRVNPRQKWLTLKIPKHFQDIDTLIETLTFACLINFWENDDGKTSLKYLYEMYDNTSDYDHNVTTEDLSRERNKLIFDTMNDAYNWAKIRDIKYEEAHAINDYDLSFVLLEEYKKIDTTHLNNIITYRSYLWT
jgi:hypothetical protein